MSNRANAYIKNLKKRSRESRAYRQFQVLGLEIAKVLGDKTHKALYIKLAKENSDEAMLRLAKEVAERKNIRNKGAYFMRLLPIRAPLTKTPPVKTNGRKTGKSK